jgi:phenylpyruvate tautomerase PptA (4-oxalocrotonate tautomerase family)
METNRMPCLMISMPRSNAEIKKQLTSDLTDAFTASTRFPKDTLGIRFLEYDPGEAANEGRLWDGSTGKPYLHMVLYSPRLQSAEKKTLIKALSKAFVDAIGDPKWIPVIFLNELSHENIGVDGQKVSPRGETYDGRKIYGDLKEDGGK